MTRAGFTFYEVMVSVGVMLVLSALAVTYSTSTREQILIFREQAAVVSMLSRARGLAAKGYTAGSNIICAYGVHFDETDGEIIVFGDFGDSAADCTDVNYAYDAGEELKEYTLHPKVSMSADASDIVFIPPDIEMKADGGAVSFPVSIKLSAGGKSADVSVAASGQITTN